MARLLERLVTPRPPERLLRLLSRRLARVAAIGGHDRLADKFALLGAEPCLYRPDGVCPPAGAPVLTVVSHELSATGAPRMALLIADICLRAGWQVIVVSPEDGPYRSELTTIGATVIVDPRALHRFSSVLVLEQASDVVICNTIVAHGLVRRLRSSNVIWYLHETGLIEELVARGVDLVKALDRPARLWVTSASVKKHLPPGSGPVDVLRATSTAASAARSLAISEDHSPLRLLVLGSIEPRKGQLELVRASLELDPKMLDRLDIRIMGHVRDRGYADMLDELLRSVSRVSRGDALTPDAALAAVRDADGVIVPSLDEPLSLVAVEALSAGRIVICSRRCGIALDLEDEVSAFIAEDATPEALAATLARAVAQSHRWSEIAANGRQVYEDRFSPVVFAQHVEATLRIVAPAAVASLRPA